MNSKKLVICGTGIKSLSHHTKEFDIEIRNADLVIYLVNEPLLEQWLQLNSKKFFSLNEIYFSHSDRDKAYKIIAEKVLASFENQNKICFVLYGHPLLLADSVNIIISKAKKKHIKVEILPGISAFDCLLADLEIRLDHGCFMIEASDLINNHIKINSEHHVIIWQVGSIDISSPPSENLKSNVEKLKDELLNYYKKDSILYLYEASIYPHLKPIIIKSNINAFIKYPISAITTVYLPPFR